MKTTLENSDTMDLGQDLEMVKRVAELVKQNKILGKQVKDLTEINEKLLRENEEQKSLLEKLSPEQTRAELLTAKPTESLKFKMATVLFADIQGFSKVSTKKSAEGVMDELDDIFFHFDQIAEKYNIEKIKTIGDTYMCAGGIPIKNSTNPVEVVMAALEMQKFIKERQTSEGEKIWDLRLGIHTGPVTATTTGKKKVSYDIKGDTVNTASRIESASIPGEVCISVMTFELVKEFFDCDFYGIMPVKYKEDMELYFVKGLESRYSVDEKGIIPNHKFNTKFLLRQFGDIQELILDKLERELPSCLYYHNVKHTIDVVTQAELIGWGEGVSDEEILILKTAGLFHDSGHIIGYQDHELNGTKIVREMLPKYKYSPEQIDAICNIIMATKMPPSPKTLLEQIICDCDLDYLGRSDFIPVSDTLYRELKEQKLIGSFNDWNKLQIKFLSVHQFYTNTAKGLREVNKQHQIDRIKKLIVDED